MEFKSNIYYDIKISNDLSVYIIVTMSRKKNTNKENYDRHACFVDCFFGVV